MKRLAREQREEQWLSLRELLRLREKRWREFLAKAREWAKELVLELGKHGIRVDAVMLFGSYARGDFSSSSDLDLVIVSSDWEGVNYTERLSLLYRLWDKDIDANSVALTPRELRDRLRKSIVLRGASKYWIVLYEED